MRASAPSAAWLAVAQAALLAGTPREPLAQRPAWPSQPPLRLQALHWSVFDRWLKLSALPTTALAQRTVSLAMVQAALLAGTREKLLAQRPVPLSHPWSFPARAFGRSQLSWANRPPMPTLTRSMRRGYRLPNAAQDCVQARSEEGTL